MMNNRCGGYVLAQSSRNQKKTPKKWERYFKEQTLKPAPASDHTAIRVIFDGLSESVSQSLSKTLFERLTWGLLSRQDCGVIVQPLDISLSTGFPEIIDNVESNSLIQIIQNGFIAVFRFQAFSACAWAESNTEALKSAVRLKIPVAVVSRALLTQKNGQQLCSPKLNDYVFGLKRFLVKYLRNKLSIKQKIWIKHQLSKYSPFFWGEKARKQSGPDYIILAEKKSWEPFFSYPKLALRTSHDRKRISVLMAMHWLELGGAEKFAVDLIKALPKDKYAIYVTTDVPSNNSWSKSLSHDVEEIIHLPEFVPPHTAQYFYDHYIRSRGIRILHIHHGPLAYESLFHIRRFHPDLVVLDTLHIIELPPNSGGYPEFSCANFEVFIDHHHVISRQIQRFLTQRWLVPENKIQVTYLNVDTDYFNPDLIEGRQVRSKFAIPKEACLVGFIGRMVQQKRPLDFVRTAELLQQRWKDTKQTGELHFIIVGGGPLFKDVKTAVNKAQLQNNFHFHDELNDTRPIYRDVDLMVMPSENEGLALVTYEAMAMKVPIFITDVGAQSELLESEFPEFLVPNDRSIAPKLADAAWPYLTDKNKCREKGEKLRKYILKHHRAEETFSEMQDLYERLIEKASALRETVS